MRTPEVTGVSRVFTCTRAIQRMQRNWTQYLQTVNDSRRISSAILIEVQLFIPSHLRIFLFRMDFEPEVNPRFAQEEESPCLLPAAHCLARGGQRSIRAGDPYVCKRKAHTFGHLQLKLEQLLHELMYRKSANTCCGRYTHIAQCITTRLDHTP